MAEVDDIMRAWFTNWTLANFAFTGVVRGRPSSAVTPVSTKKRQSPAQSKSSPVPAEKVPVVHELSIAYSLVEAAEEAARAANATSVAVVNLRLGQLAGVVVDSLRFGWEIATEGTLLAGATLAIEEVPLIVHCAQCDRDVELPSAQWFYCPVCGAPTPTVVQGRELELKSMEIMHE